MLSQRLREKGRKWSQVFSWPHMVLPPRIPATCYRSLQGLGESFSSFVSCSRAAAPGSCNAMRNAFRAGEVPHGVSCPGRVEACHTAHATHATASAIYPRSQSGRSAASARNPATQTLSQCLNVSSFIPLHTAVTEQVCFLQKFSLA